jgi:predicted acylesterase/phospholipase RssA
MPAANVAPTATSNRPRIGLALSGGGMRAMLFHLGVVRYLRDTGRLQDVTHLCSVSGGSVLAAHMGANWDQYLFDYETVGPGTPKELLNFAEHDVRNRIFRRAFSPWMLVRHALSPSSSTTNLLRGYYDRLLFHGAMLSDMAPKPWKADDLSPEVHLLTTAMELGALASFSHDGLRLKFDQAEPLPLIDIPHESLAMAVAASSAFPMFFPPVKLTPEQFGRTRAQFCDRARLLLNDGGVFDNLGISPFLANQDKWRCTQVIVSDASRVSEIHNLDGRWSMINHVAGLNRAYDIAATRLYRHQLCHFPPHFAHISIQQALAPAKVSSGTLSIADRLRLKDVRTDFDALPGPVIRALVVHGQACARESLDLSGPKAKAA